MRLETRIATPAVRKRSSESSIEESTRHSLATMLL